MATFIYYQILGNTLTLKLKSHENISSILPIDIHGVINTCMSPGPYTNLKSTCKRVTT